MRWSAAHMWWSVRANGLSTRACRSLTSNVTSPTLHHINGTALNNTYEHVNISPKILSANCMSIVGANNMNRFQRNRLLRIWITGLSDGDEIKPLTFFVLTQYWRVTDKRPALFWLWSTLLRQWSYNIAWCAWISWISWIFVLGSTSDGIYAIARIC